MSAKYAVVLHTGPDDAFWGRYCARVVEGTIDRYYPGGIGNVVRRPSAQWAKRVATRKIRRIEAADLRRRRRHAHAQRVTGYDR